MYGYPTVGLFDERGKQRCVVHRLVALAFIPQEEGKTCVNHKDENKRNNCVSNLEWCTTAYNNTYGDMPKRRAYNRARTIILSRDGVMVATFASIVYMAKVFGVDPSTLGKVLRSTGRWRGYDISYASRGTNKSGVGCFAKGG